MGMLRRFMEAMISMLGGHTSEQVGRLIADAMPPMPTVNVLGSPVATAASVAVIIYSANNKSIRRIVVPTSDNALLKTPPDRKSGELAITVPIAQIKTTDDAKAAVFAATGVAPSSGLCAVIERGVVTHLIQADPFVDSAPGVTLISNEAAQPGDVFLGGVLLRDVALVNLKTKAVTQISQERIDRLDMAPPGFRYVPAEKLKIGDDASVWFDAPK